MKKLGICLATFIFVMSFVMPVFAESSVPYEEKETKELPESEMIVPKVTKITDDPDISNIPNGTGEWDYLGSSTFKYQSKTFYSGGGDLKIYISIPYKGSAKWLFKLKEDPA